MVTKKSVCLFCSLGCGVAMRAAGENVTALDYDKENPVNQGSLCPRGHYNLELVSHPGRLTEPLIGKRKVTWEEAISFIKQELKYFQQAEIGCLVSCLASNENALAAVRLAKALGVNNILAAATAADLEAYEGAKWEVAGAQLAGLDDIEQSEALLIVGDIMNRTPVLAKRVNKVKYGKRGNKIIVVDPNKTHTSWFATNHLVCRPGTEAVVLAALAGELKPEEAEPLCGVAAGQISRAADEFRTAAKGTVIYVPQQQKLRNDLAVFYAKKLAAASAGKKFIVYYLFGNTLGVNTIIDREMPGHPTYHELLARIEAGEIKSLLMFGEDISAGHAELQKKFRMLKFVVFAGYFESEAPAIYDNSIILPLATQLEGGGSFILADGRTEKAEPIVPPAGQKDLSGIGAQLAEISLADNEAAQVIGQGLITKVKATDEALAEVRAIQPLSAATVEPITDFGNNHLVSNFFWYRANSPAEVQG